MFSSTLAFGSARERAERHNVVVRHWKERQSGAHGRPVPRFWHTAEKEVVGEKTDAEKKNSCTLVFAMMHRDMIRLAAPFLIGAIRAIRRKYLLQKPPPF
jgi:hypothetical protein